MITAVTRAKAYLKVRHKNVRDAMRELQLDGLLLTHPADIAYLTNFGGEDSVALVTDREFHLVTDFRYEEQGQLEAGWLKLKIREGKMEEALAKVLSGASGVKLKKIGYEANFATVGQIDALSWALKEGHA